MTKNVTGNQRYIQFPSNLDSGIILLRARFLALFVIYPPRENFLFYLLKIGAKSFGDQSQDICKDTESNLGPFAGF